jgi:starch-binding outer membrane protein, SusD/RagB family
MFNIYCLKEMKKYIIYTSLFVTLLFASSCKEEYTNPSSANLEQATSSVNGLIAVANGIQFRYTIGRASPVYAAITASGLSTRELTVLNAGNTDEEFLRLGGSNVQGANSVVSNLWNQSNLVKANAEIILTNANNVQDAGTRSGLIAYASIFKALALGNLGTFWEQAPIAVSENATFSSRTEVLKAAITTLETAATTVSANAPSAYFSSFIAPGIDIPNTIQALIARYAIMIGDNDKALAAAAKVDLTKRSAFNFDDITRNPMFDATFGNRNVTEPVNRTFNLSGGLAVNAADKRIGFYFQSANTTFNSARASFFTANTAQIPVYLPGEISLILAEANARKGNIDAAITELNKVLTKKTDVWGIGADLPAYAGEKTADAVLTEIYRNRCIELFLSGLKLEDSRRFGRPAAATAATSERTRNFYPYPLSERDNNKANTPADPTI